ncbi:S-type pyocin domain-containing protein, partial [Klebsiella pneumoniae]|nr:S-type pyocin domain-containing protein [Klebsiella pneumoniae]
RAVLDKETGYWGYTLPAVADVPAQTIFVSPADEPGANGPLTLSGPVPLPERILHTGDQISAPQATDKTVTPVADD